MAYGRMCLLTYSFFTKWNGKKFIIKSQSETLRPSYSLGSGSTPGSVVKWPNFEKLIHPRLYFSVRALNSRVRKQIRVAKFLFLSPDFTMIVADRFLRDSAFAFSPAPLCTDESILEAVTSSSDGF
eukprot:IDg7061t1